jgi:hypothetical protein
MTVEKFASVFGVDKGIAYGLLRFLAETGLCKIEKQKKPEGKMGKPSILYMFDATIGSRLATYLSKFIKEFQETVATSATTDTVST